MPSSPTVPDDAIKHPADRAAGEDAVAVRAVTIGGKTRDDLYAFWRDLPNLARFMENIERIDLLDGDRSHWVVTGPGGHSLEWNARITVDEPGRRIGWASDEGAEIKNHGLVEFRDAPFGRGAEIHATIIYHPPGGAIGKLVAELFQKEPGMQAKRDLRRLKMLLETGEIATTRYPDAAPRYKKSDATDEIRRAEVR